MIAFAISIFGEQQINYLYVLLQSISDTYQDDAFAIVYYANINPDIINIIRRKAPFVLLREYTSIDFSFKDNAHKASYKTTGWRKIIEEQTWPENFVFLDVDTFVIRKVNKYFKSNADIIFTYKTNKDENLEWPINSGVVLTRNGLFARKFFANWNNKTLEILNASPYNNELQRKIWGGEDQAAMAHCIGRKVFNNSIVNNGILFKGISCEELNEARCTPITEKTHIIHYKGKWRPVLIQKKFTGSRPKVKCQVMYDLWMDALKKWEER